MDRESTMRSIKHHYKNSILQKIFRFSDSFSLYYTPLFFVMLVLPSNRIANLLSVQYSLRE